MGGRSSKVGPQPDERSVDQFERNMRGLSLNTFIGSRSGELGENWLKLALERFGSTSCGWE
jgi:hypothetical protein